MVGRPGRGHALIKRLQAGDKDAFWGMGARPISGVYTATACVFAGNQQDAEDLTQEVFIRAYRGIHRFRQQSQLSTWLYQIAHNACVDYLQPGQKRPVVLSIQAQEEERPGRDMVSDTQPLPEQRAVQRENIDTLKECLETLSRNHRAVTLLQAYAAFIVSGDRRSDEDSPGDGEVPYLPRPAVSQGLYDGKRRTPRKGGGLSMDCREGGKITAPMDRRRNQR